MIIIADSGSTKTNWVIVENKQIDYITTIGLNPYFHTKETIIEALDKHFIKYSQILIDKIFFYGAGCSTENKCNLIKNAIKNIFNIKEENIHIYHDLLGAARCICGNDEGIAGILGTGSNSCYFDGKNIKKTIYSLGYMFGDEGSGAYIGKKLIYDYLKKRMPTSLIDKFNDIYKLSYEQILENIYNRPYPNRFLASFSNFISQNINEEYCYKLIYNSFTDYINEQILIYPQCHNLPFGCVGSVAFAYATILKQVSIEKNLNLTIIEKDPLNKLIEYHTSTNL